MTKQIILFFIFSITLFASVIQAPILSVNESAQTVTIKIDRIDVGVSGFIVHRLGKYNSSILKDTTVIDFDSSTKIATLRMMEFNQLVQNALPKGNWKVEVGDIAILAFGYSRALLIAPTEEIYYKITRATKQLQWIHPDFFATILSLNGHPTPLKKDFKEMSISTSAGLLFFYLNQKLLTVDAQSMKILNISTVRLNQDSAQLPFYSRVEQIESNWYNWFDKGSKDLAGYEQYYCSLLAKNNPKNAQLREICSMKNNYL